MSLEVRGIVRKATEAGVESGIKKKGWHSAVLWIVSEAEAVLKCFIRNTPEWDDQIKPYHPSAALFYAAH